jgi:hypothetical protein
MREETGTSEERETTPSFDLHTRLFIYLSCQKVTNTCWMSNHARRRQTVPRPSAFPSGVKDRMTAAMTRLFPHLPCIPFHRRTGRINKGEINGESSGLWMGGGCLSAPAKRGCMSHSLGFTRPRRVANRLFANSSQHKPRHFLSGPKV